VTTNKQELISIQRDLMVKVGKEKECVKFSKKITGNMLLSADNTILSVDE
jgi:hypothetical protein